MKNWMTRFGVLVAVAAVMGSALMVGCGGGGDEPDVVVVNNAAAPAGGASED